MPQTCIFRLKNIEPLWKLDAALTKTRVLFIESAFWIVSEKVAQWLENRGYEKGLKLWSAVRFMDDGTIAFHSPLTNKHALAAEIREIVKGGIDNVLKNLNAFEDVLCAIGDMEMR